MAKNPLKLLICRTCVRDNPGTGPLNTTETIEKEYRDQLKKGIFSSVADIDMQNCFAECENFHCVQLTDEKGGFRLKKISSPQKIEQVVQWVKDCRSQGKVLLPEHLQENLLETIDLEEI